MCKAKTTITPVSEADWIEITEGDADALVNVISDGTIRDRYRQKDSPLTAKR